MNIFKTSWLVIIKFHLKHYWGRELTALCFGPERIRTLVSMGYNGENFESTLALPFFIGSSLFLLVTMTAVKAWMGSNFSKIDLGSAE